MKLLDYLKSHSLTHREFGEKVGVSQVHITQIISGAKNPSIQLINRINLVTNGEVTSLDLLHSAAPSRLKSRKKKKTIEEIKT